MSEKQELVFIPSPVTGHLASAVEMAKLLTSRDDRLWITVLKMKLPMESKISPYTLSEDPNSRIRFRELTYSVPEHTSENFATFMADIESHKPQVQEIAGEIVRSKSAKLAGIVLDMFCTTMIDVANEFGVPSYLFFTSSASFLDIMFHLQSLHDDHGLDITEFKDSDSELSVPSFSNPVPAKFLPDVILNNEGESAIFLGFARRFREVKGIMVNTFTELESYALDSFSGGIYPKVYPVGPLLNLNGGTQKNGQTETITRWLDDQPTESVVFLCFGSMGSFSEDQVKEIALALEQSGSHFLWSLRRPLSKTKLELPGEYIDLQEVLPDGFLERTAGIGKVIGWAPQVTVLSHRAVGGFISHCGWNSILESIWCAVPIATWPMYAEQQINAFQMVKELQLGVEIKLDYRKGFKSDNQQVVTAEEIESGIRKLMVDNEDVRERVKDMRQKSRVAVLESGSSYINMRRFIEDVIYNVS